jgi:hypothetical protein
MAESLSDSTKIAKENEDAESIYFVLKCLLKQQDDLAQMNLRMVTLEKSLAEQQNLIAAKDKQIKDLEAQLENIAMLRTYKLDRAMKQVIEPQSKLSTGQELWELKQDVLDVFTPELLCQKMKKDVEHLDLTEELIHLTKKTYRMLQIYRTCKSKSNSSIDPEPLPDETIGRLRALPSKLKKKHIRQLKKEIVDIYENDNGLCIMLEIDDQLSKKDTVDEKKDYLQAMLAFGAILENSEQTSLMGPLKFWKRSGSSN